MATENPILMAGSNERWGNSRQGSGSVPNRSGSAPPSMEGSFLAVDNLLSRHASGYNLKLPSFKNHGFEAPVTVDPSYSSKANLNRIQSPPIYFTENSEVMNDVDVGRFKSSPGLGLYKVNSPIHLSQPTLSTHKEVSEDETSQPQALNTLVSDRTDGDGVISGLMEISLLPDSQRFSGFRQDNISSDLTPQHSCSNSLNGEINAAEENSNLSEMSDDAKNTMVKDKAASSSKGIPSLLHESTGTDIENTSDESSTSSKLKKTNISGTTTTRENKYPQETRNHQFNLSERQLHQQRNNISGIQGVKRGSHVANDSIAGTFGQHLLQSSGFTPPHYPTTQTPYLTSPNYVYNMHSPGVYCPPYGYGYGTYTITPNMISQSQFVPGYPPHASVPLIVRPDFVPQSSGASMGNVVHGGEFQYAEKIPPEQPSFPDPMYMQYCQQSFGQAYNTPGQMNLLAPRNVAPGNHKNSHDTQNHETRGIQQINMGGNGMMGHNYYGIQPNMAILVQYLPTQLGPPLSPGSTPYVETYPGWQHQGSLGEAKGPRLYNFLEELKSGKGRRFDLCDIAGHIVEFSVDQHGSRFIQQKLENCNPDDKAAVFREVLPHACKLMTDVFGNYVIQRFFEYGNSGQRKDLADQLMGQIVPLSLQMYGCRVIQKALDVIEVDQKVRLARELDGQVMRCVRDQNGNHVIQKCIESIPTDRISFILSAFHGQVSSLSMHPYGCRVIQRLLERCSNEHQCRFITEEILESVCLLSKDQYGNYVTQYVLEKGRAEERERIVRKLSGHIVQLSLHKFASNVIEKCLEHGGRIERDLIIKEIAGVNESYDSLLMMMKDQYGNYVVRKIFETCTDDQRATLLTRVKTHASALKKYTYGKHIVTRLEQPFSKVSQEMR